MSHSKKEEKSDPSSLKETSSLPSGPSAQLHPAGHHLGRIAPVPKGLRSALHALQKD